MRPAGEARPHPRRRPRTRTPPAVVSLVAVASAALCALAGAEPTGNDLADLVWSAAFGASASLALADGRRWSWFPPAAIGLAVAGDWLALVAGLAAVAAVVTFAFGDRPRRRWMGAVVGLLASTALIRGRSYGVTGLPTLVGAAAWIPAYVSAFSATSRRARSVAKVALIVSAVVIGLLSIFTAVSAARARTSVERAIRFGDQAVAAAERGDQELAGILVGAAGDELRSIADDFNQPWLAPGRLVPVLGQHSRALRTMADAGADVANRGAAVLEHLDADRLLAGPGEVDVAEVAEAVPDLTRLFDALERSRTRVAGIDLTWIATPAASRIEDIADELATLDEPVRTARELTEVLPAMLGQGEPRRYLIVFMTPVELRAGGGFAGNWAEIEVTNGALDLVEAGRGDDLNNRLPAGGAVLPDDEALLAYEGFRVGELFQNLPVIADFPWVADGAAAFYEQATGREVDAVIGVDVEAMAGLVTLTGPVEVDGRRLDRRALESFVIRDQYEIYDGDEAGRIAALEELTQNVFTQLTEGELPTPFAFADVVGPLVDGGHLKVVAFRPDEAESLATLDVDGAFPEPRGQDLLSVITQNIGENKIDSFLQRNLTYQVLHEPETGRVQASLTVELVNSAPADGLAQAIIGNNDQGLPFGTNAMRLQIHTPLEFRNATITDATLDNEPVNVRIDDQFGWRQYERDILIGPGETVIFRIDLVGTLARTGDYVLQIDPQTMVNPDTLALDIRTVGSQNSETLHGWPVAGGARVPLTTDLLVRTASAGEPIGLGP